MTQTRPPHEEPRSSGEKVTLSAIRGGLAHSASPPGGPVRWDPFSLFCPQNKALSPQHGARSAAPCSYASLPSRKSPPPRLPNTLASPCLRLWSPGLSLLSLFTCHNSSPTQSSVAPLPLGSLPSTPSHSGLPVLCTNTLATAASPSTGPTCPSKKSCVKLSH